METHYHIRWSTGTLDWERFETTGDSEAAANELVQPGETFAVEQYAKEGRPQCSNLLTTRSSRKLLTGNI